MGLYYHHLDFYKETKSNTVRLRFANAPLVLSRDKNFYSQVLGAKAKDFNFPDNFKVLFSHFFPNSIFSVDYKEWHKIRKIITKAMNKTSYEPVVPSIVKSINYALNTKTQEGDKEVILSNSMKSFDFISRVTFDAFHKLVYKWDPESLKPGSAGIKLQESCNLISSAVGERYLFVVPFLWKLPTKKNKMYDAAAKHLRDFAEKFVIEQKELLKTNKEEILAMKQRSLLQEMLVASELEEEEAGRLNHDELIDQVITLFFAAFDTTSNVLSFALNFLATNPEVQDKLRQEIWEAFPKGEEDILEGGIQAIEKLTYLKYVLEEVHRCRPLTTLSRTCIQDTEINGLQVKKGDMILIDNLGIGLNKDNWNNQEDLDQFKPERWETYKPGSFEATMPFGFGARICPGKRLATYEIKCFLIASLLHHRMVQRVPGEKQEFTFMLGFSYTHGTGNVDFERI
eukprot:CAMPEP_0170514772 /NCGR_PEP_ID=MMETSP0209-20121228/1326_1 /TAXON_ID=665100 ORGANISM="Litonotus pictus, Strain P1" /NCGR_SAMPLE_ID=MMETSP0209 /ASSEMBLY_ACC=CAM_ASM_000301 /LENGTH=455 /DNA_ID=CAMNT_0010798989 /DNA_START=137 /DNA_END=1504 /DNA_ORIENTATION=+